MADSPHYHPVYEMPSLVRPIWIVFSIILGAFSLKICVLDSSSESIDRAFAILIIAALLISPLGWIYYLPISSGPIAILIYSWVINRRLSDQSELRRSEKIKIGLIIAFSLGCLFPFPAALLFQPNAFFTISLGSFYFWAYLSIWGYLVMDFSFLNSPRGATRPGWSVP
jgi:hypothetical protein